MKFSHQVLYKFVNFTKLYKYPKPFLHDKRVRTYITHGKSMLLSSYTISEFGETKIGDGSIYICIWMETQ